MKTKKKLLAGRWILYLPALVAVFAIAFLIAGHRKQREQNRKALAIGVINASPVVQARHIWITEKQRPTNPRGDIPVHILTRKSPDDPWWLCGTGTVSGLNQTHMISAYHVFEELRGQFGVRSISADAFSGTASIIPIVRVKQVEDAYDAVLCELGYTAPEFPMLELPRSPRLLRQWEADKAYEVSSMFVTIRFNTYPDIKICTFMSVEVQPGVREIFFDWTPVPGESGTAASIDGWDINAYLIVVAAKEVPAAAYHALPADIKERMNWSPDKIYGIGHLVGLRF